MYIFTKSGKEAAGGGKSRIAGREKAEKPGAGAERRKRKKEKFINK